ncbi:MAG: alpha/beta hydrolase family protein [Solirubrobacteraceae bacterium]
MSDPQPAVQKVAFPALSPVISGRPAVLPAPGRGADLQVRVTAPTTGRALPIVVFSHGFGESMDGYAPLAEFWAAHGFAVLQPTHLDSQTLGIAPDDPRTPVIWRFRIEDLTRVLDELDLIEASVPGLAGRLDHERIAVAGHSWGATTASALVGARIVKDGNVGEDMSDPRVATGVLLAVAGTGGEDLTAFAAEHFSFMNPNFAQMTTPALLVAGDQDKSPLSTRGPDWWTDAYTLSPADKSLLTLFGAEHTMGGIAGYSVHETIDWSRERIALIQQVTTAYLRSALNLAGEAWSQAQAALANDSHPLGRLQSK